MADCYKCQRGKTRCCDIPITKRQVTGGLLDLTKEEISGADCVTKVIGKLDELWKDDDKKQAFNAYESFEQFRRPTEMGITEFLNAFERLNNKLKKHNMTLPEGVLAYRVLKSANLTTEQEQLARATVTDITYKAMCDKLKSILEIIHVQTSIPLHINQL